MPDDKVWCRFTADYDHRIGHLSTTAYKAGMRCLVSRACFDAATKAGRAQAMQTPGPDFAEVLKADPFAPDPHPDPHPEPSAGA